MTARYGNLVGVSGSGGSPTSLVANNDSDSGPEDVILEGNVLDNDTTESGTLAILEYRVTTPGADYPTVYQPGQPATIGALGTFVMAADGDYSFTPAGNYSGPVAAIRYTVTNGSEFRQATLNITITPVNDVPTAGDAAALSFSGETVTIILGDFVTDPDPLATITLTHINGDAVVLNAVEDIEDGSVEGTYEWLGGTTVEIVPADGTPGTLEFEYTITDGSASDTGSVLVQIGVENTPLFSPISPLIGTPIDTAAFNFGKTYRRKYGPTDDNGVSVASPPYSTGQGLVAVDPVYQSPNDREPWLYNRATTTWILAKRTNNPAVLADAMQLARGYMAGVVLAGNGNATFNIIGATGGDPTDPKYLYADVAWWYEKEILAAGGTAEQAQVYRNRAEGLYRQTLISFTQTYNGGTAELWTERNSWAAQMNCLSWYWISGSTAALADAEAYAEDILLLSESSGAPLHTKDKHESDGDPTLIISPWMSSLVAEAMLQLHRTTDSEGLSKSVPEWFSDFGDWLLDNAFYVATGSEEPELVGLAGLRIPAYLVGTGVMFPEGEAADMQHCTNVAELMRKVKWAKEELSLDTTEVDEVINELEEAAEVDIAYWTRGTVGYPRYRVNPPRKYGWQYRNRYSYAHSVGIVPFPPSLTTTPVVTGSTQAGSTLTCSDGVWAGTPTPTYAFQWQHRVSGVWSDVADTNNQYVTTSEAGNGVRCRVTATNSGGSAQAFSNVIEVVAAGSPEVTVQPTNEQALVGQTAQFTATCTATPTAAYQWQVSINDGSSWNNVAEGTGGSGTANTTTYTTETLAGDDDGDQYRCIFTNIGGSVTSDEVLLTMVVQQEAAAFASSAQYGVLTFAFGEAGFVDWTIAGWVYLASVVNNASAFGVEGIAGRRALVQYNNSGVFGIGDSNTGTTGGSFDVPIPANTWVFLVYRGTPSFPGNFQADWYEEDGTHGGTASRANGIEGSVAPQALMINGGNVATGFSMRCQFVRAYDRRLSDVEADAELANTDMGTANLLYYNVFEDDGGGGVSVRDASGHNREFTLTGATLSSGGPVAPSV